MYPLSLRIAVALSCVVFFLIPTAGHAVDNRCFTRTECHDTRSKYGLTETEVTKGFYQSSETVAACGGLKKTGAAENSTGEDLGFCLPAGQSLTAISFGGKNEFSNIGEFLQYIYQYGFIIASIIAVIIIIIAGLQWTVSGGNSATIESAKTRIKGAIIGLIILALSYTILQTINPRTVNLRLPQIWLINPAELTPKYCNQTTVDLAFFKEQQEQLDPKETDKRIKNPTFLSQEKRPSACGSIYIPEGSGNLTCRGVSCEPNHICAPQERDSTKDKCYRGDMVAKVVNNGLTLFPDLLTEAWDTPPIDEGETELYGLCINGTLFPIPSRDNTQTVGNNYIVTLTFDDKQGIPSLVESTCLQKEFFRGFVWRFEMDENNDPDDENHFIGRGGKDLGDDAAFEVIKFNPDIKKYLYTLEEVTTGKLSGEQIDVSAITDIDNNNPIFGGLSDDDLRRKIYADVGFK